MPSSLSIGEPYELIFHNREKILQAGRANKYIREILNKVKKLCPLAWEKLDEIEEKTCDKITFEHLWLL